MPVEEHGGWPLDGHDTPDMHGAARRGPERQLDHEQRAAFRRVVNPQAAVMEIDQLAGDVEAETGAAHPAGRAAVELVEALEDLVAPVRGDARAAVGHLDTRRVPGRCGA